MACQETLSLRQSTVVFDLGRNIDSQTQIALDDVGASL